MMRLRIPAVCRTQTHVSIKMATLEHPGAEELAAAVLAGQPVSFTMTHCMANMPSCASTEIRCELKIIYTQGDMRGVFLAVEGCITFLPENCSDLLKTWYSLRIPKQPTRIAAKAMENTMIAEARVCFQDSAGAGDCSLAIEFDRLWEGEERYF